MTAVPGAESGANQGVRDAEVVVGASGAKPDPKPELTGIPALVDRVFALKPVRVVLHFNQAHGPLLASGMAYQAVFALFASLWLAVSIAGFVIRGNPVVREALFTTLSRAIPGLLSTGGAKGAIDPRTLLEPAALGVGSIISLLGLVLTAVGFLATLRTAVRIVFEVPDPTELPIVRWLKDLGLAVAFGAVLLVSAVISLLTTSALGLVLNLLGVGKGSLLATVAPGAVGAVLILLIDATLIAAAFRILSALRVPARRLWAGALLGGLGLATLQTLGSSLLGGARSNPLLAGFAVIVGLLIYFNLVATVILIAASWIATGLRDAGIDPRDLSTEERAADNAVELEEARRRVADANRGELEERVRAARGLRRRHLRLALEQEIEAEERRRRAVPTVSEFREDQHRSHDPDPGADEVAAEELARDEQASEGPVGRPS